MIPAKVQLMDIRERQRELWGEAEAFRRRRAARAHRPRRRDRYVYALGTHLIRWGLWVRQHARCTTAYACNISMVRTRKVSA